MTTRIELPELHPRLNRDTQLVEVLPPAEYAKVHLAGAINIPLKELERVRTTGLDGCQPIVVYGYDYL